MTVTGEKYRAMLRNFLWPAIEIRVRVWFQQDGAAAHTARESMQLLRKRFNGRIISRFSDINWPSRSPDLTSPDFFLGISKGKGFCQQALIFNRVKGKYH